MSSFVDAARVERKGLLTSCHGCLGVVMSSRLGCGFWSIVIPWDMSETAGPKMSVVGSVCHFLGDLSMPMQWVLIALCPGDSFGDALVLAHTLLGTDGLQLSG